MTSDPDFKRAYPLAQLSSGVYETSLNELSLTAATLGFNFVGVVEAPGFQVMVVADPETGEQIVVFRGTPVTCGRDIRDTFTAVLADVEWGMTDVGAGAKVLTAPYELVRQNLLRITRLLDFSKPITVTGHSLGAVSGLIFAGLIPRTVDLTVIVFAPFQCANAAFWSAIFGGRRQPLVIGRERDFAPGWDHLDPATSLTGPVCHLADSTWEWVTAWPLYDESEPDHSVTAYLADVGRLAGALVPA